MIFLFFHCTLWNTSWSLISFSLHPVNCFYLFIGVVWKVVFLTPLPILINNFSHDLFYFLQSTPLYSRESLRGVSAKGVQRRGQTLGREESFSKTPLWQCTCPTITHGSICPNLNFPMALGNKDSAMPFASCNYIIRILCRNSCLKIFGSLLAKT